MRDKLVQIWVNLTEPIDSVHGDEARQKARFMASLYVIMLPLGALMLGLGGFLQYSGDFFRDNDFLVMTPAALIWLAAYTMSKRGQYELATVISIGVAFIGIFLGAALDTDETVHEIAFLLFPILLSSIMLGYRITSILVGIGFVLAIITPVINPQVSVQDAVAGPITFLLVGSAMILISNYHRDRLERVRREELSELQDRARKMLASSYEGMCIVDEDTITEANYAFASMLGYAPEEIIGLKIKDLTSPEIRESNVQSLRELLAITNEVPVQRNDGAQIYVELLPQQEESAGRLVDVLAVREITERKKAELALKEAEERYSAVITQSSDCIFLVDVETMQVIDANQALLDLLGYQSDEVLALSLYDFVDHPREDVDAKTRRILLARGAYLGERTYRRKDGSTLLVEVTVSLIEYADQKVMSVTARDLTERKQAEGELAKLRKAVQTSGEIIFMTDPEGVLTYINPEFTNQYGYTAEEVIGKVTPRILKSGNRSPEDYADFWQQLLDEDIVKAEIRNKRKDGSLVDIETTINAILEDDEIVGFLAIQRDITSRKQAEAALRQETEKAQTYLQVAEVMFLALDQQGCITLINLKGCEILGLPEKEIVGKNWFETFLPAEIQYQVKEKWKRIMVGEIESAEYYENRIVTHSGQERMIAWHNALLRDEAGDIIGVLSSGEDITERRLAALQLEKSEARYRAVVEDQIDLINRSSLDGKITFVNSAYADFFDLDPKEIIGKTHAAFLDEEGMQEISNFQKLLSADNPVLTNETRFELPDERIVWIQWVNRLILDNDGNPLEYQGVGTDITYLKQMQEALAKSENDYRGIFEGAHDAIVVITPDDETILDANQRARDMYGFSSEEFIGTSMEMVTKDVARGKTYLADVLEKGHIYHFDSVHLDRQGNEIYVEANASPIEYQGQTALLTIIRNVSDQIRAQRDLKRRALEYESLYASSQATGRLLPHDELYRHIQKEVTRFMSVDIFGVALWRADDNEFEVAHLYEDGELKSELIGLRLSPEKAGLASWVVDNQQTLLLNDFESERHKYTVSQISGDVPKAWMGVPILAGEQVLGVLTVQSSQLQAFSSSDEKYLELLGAQLGTALENSRLYAAEQHQASELERANSLTNALSKVAAQISVTVDPEEVLETLGEELRLFGIDSAVTLMRPDEDIATIDYVSISAKILKQLERLAGKSFRGFEMPRSTWAPLPTKALAEDQPQFAPNFAEAILPGFEGLVPKSVVRRGLELVGLHSEIPGMFLPFQADDKTTGILTIWGQALREDDLSTFSIFTSQLAAAYENARLFAAEQRQARELERSNAVVHALSRISAEVIATSEPDFVFETLGRELRSLGMNYTYTSVNKTAGLAVIEYLSIDSKILQTIQKLTKTPLSGFRIPEERWTSEAIQASEEDRAVFTPNYVQSITPLFSSIESSLVTQGLKLAGITEATKGVYLPMQLGPDAVGLLNIWGDKLREADLPAFRVFAAQVSSILDKARLHEAERQQAAEVARSNSLVYALSRVAANISSTTDPDEILDIVSAELQNLGIESFLALLKPDGQTVYFERFSYNAKLLKQFEKLSGLNLGSYEMPQDIWPEFFTQVFENNEIKFLSPFASEILPYLPTKESEKIASLTLRALGISEHTSAFYMPMTDGGQTFGALGIWGESLLKEDAAAYSVFASQLASVYQNARLYEAERQQAAELDRSNVLISVLNNVGTQIAASDNPDEVLESLGTELKALDLNCAVMILSSDRQDTIIHYLSVDSPILEKAEKIADLNAIGFKINRSRWEPEIESLYDEGQPVFVPEFLVSTVEVVDFVPRKVLEGGMRMVGIDPDMSAIYVPMTMDNSVFGALCVWGSDLLEKDLPAFSAFGNQVANAFENARLRQVDLLKTTELERSNKMLTVLNDVAAKISVTFDPNEALETLSKLLAQFGLEATVALIDEKDRSLVFRFHSMSSRLLRHAEKLAGVSLLGYRIPLNELPSILTPIFLERQALFTPNLQSFGASIFSQFPRSLAEKGAQLAGITSTTAAVYLPLEVEDRVIGLIGIWGELLHQADVPIFAIFANQVANSFEKARLYEKERHQAKDLEHSNALITALSRVAAQLATRFEPEEVLQTLGDQLKQLDLDCLVALIDPDKQSLRVHYTSMAPRIFSLVERMLDRGFINRSISIFQLPPGLSQVVEDKRPTFFPDYFDFVETVAGEDPESLRGRAFQQILSTMGMSSQTAMLNLPLTVEERLIGTISIWGETLEEKARPAFLVFANQVASAFENARLYAAEQHQIQRLNALRTIDKVISSSHDEHTIFETVLEQVTAQLEVDAAALLLLRPSTNALEFVAGCGLRSDAVQTSSVPISDNGLGHIGFDRRLVQLPDISQSQNGFKDDARLKAEDARSYFAAPLFVDRQIKGMLEVYHREPLNPDEEWLDFLETLAGQAAIALDNTQLFDSLQQSNTNLLQAYNATLEGWAKALELRDNETEGHSQRVTTMTIQLARHLGLSEEAIVDVRRGALLHDIGKMGIPDSILHKPGPLDDDEWEIMHRHPAHAFELLSRIGYLSAALDIPYCHHEKWNGTGYPRGLEGEQIPLAARVFAVIDVYDALTSDRPYRKAWSQEKTLAYITEESGQHFDPMVVNAFLDMLTDHRSDGDKHSALSEG